METKLFELRDRGTFIPVMALRLGSDNEGERYLLSRAGYGKDNRTQQTYVLFGRIGPEPVRLEYSHYGSRTFSTAYKYVQENWEELKSGQVIDVEFIKGETEAPKESENSGL